MSLVSDDCMDSFENLINALFSIFNFNNNSNNNKNNSLTSDIFKVFEFFIKLILFLMIFPAIPFYVVMAFALSTIKYLTLKLSLLDNKAASQIVPLFISPSLIRTKVLNRFFLNLPAKAIPPATGNPCPNDPVENSTPGIFL